MRFRSLLLCGVLVPIMTMPVAALAKGTVAQAKSNTPHVSHQAARAKALRLLGDLDIKFDTFTLPNGLDVIVVPDATQSQVLVSMTYRVGARNEPAGRSGFAHLFEHLMF